MSNTLKSLASLILISSIAMSFTTSAMTTDTSSKIASHNMHQHGGKHQMKRQLKKMAKYLSLSDEQRQKVKEIFKQTKEEKMAIKESLAGYKTQVKSVMDAAIFDEKAFKDLHSQYQSQLTEGALLKAKTKHALLQLLTQEQREKLENFKGQAGRLFH